MHDMNSPEYTADILTRTLFSSRRIDGCETARAGLLSLEALQVWRWHIYD